ncbi:hypothetical protein WR25_02373 [Diploscapter pachys]|uniref:Uncharacterized protein n=1 Tax=Diploscapter pachys TaxID=2018661 RepID=A0A2A2JZZ7_9BILA|nr:hypothetical protein WR25_02373 [Diploscapter pachys]
MQARQVGAQLRRQPALPLRTGLGAEQAPGGDARHVFHEEEHPPMHPRVTAQPERSRYLDPGLVDHLQHGELLFAAEAGRQRRQCVTAQDPAPVTGPGTTLDQQVEPPVFLDGTTAQALARGDEHPLGGGAFANEVDQLLVVVAGRDRIAGQRRRGGTAHGSMGPAFAGELATGPEQSLGQLSTIHLQAP